MPGPAYSIVQQASYRSPPTETPTAFDPLSSATLTPTQANKAFFRAIGIYCLGGRSIVSVDEDGYLPSIKPSEAGDGADDVVEKYHDADVGVVRICEGFGPVIFIPIANTE